MPADPRFARPYRPRRPRKRRPPRELPRVGPVGVLAAAVSAFPIPAALFALTAFVGIILQTPGTVLALGAFAGLWVRPQFRLAPVLIGLLLLPAVLTGPLVLTGWPQHGQEQPVLPALVSAGLVGVLIGFAAGSLWGTDREVNGRFTLWYAGLAGVAVLGAWIGSFMTGRWTVPPPQDLALMSVVSRYAEPPADPNAPRLVNPPDEPATASFLPRLRPVDDRHDPFGLPRDWFNGGVDHLFRLALGVPFGLLVGGAGRWVRAGLERDRARAEGADEPDDEPEVVAEVPEDPVTVGPGPVRTRVQPPPLPVREQTVPLKTVTAGPPEPVTAVYQPAAVVTDATVDQPVQPGPGRPVIPDFGEYDVLAEIGRGGMGQVYKARHRRLGRLVALKTVLARHAPSAAVIERFRGEARAAAQLDHPGIVPVYEFNEHAGQFFFTMAFVEGRSLAARLEEGPLDPTQAAFLVQQAAEATDFAHRNRIVHRDIKPGNIMLDRDGTVRVTDFGLARQLDAADAPDDPPDDFPFADTYQTVCRLTRTGAVMGTPAYMAPEQGLDAKQAGPPADVWALGAVLYACLTGRPPFVGATAVETIALVIEADPPRPRDINPEVDPDLEAVCLRCLEKAQADRYESAAALAADLAKWRAGKTPGAARVSWFERARRFDASYPEALPLVAGVVGQHLGTLQEGLFVGCALAATRLPARMPSVQRVLLSAVIWAVLLGILPVNHVLSPTSRYVADPAVTASSGSTAGAPRDLVLLIGSVGVGLSLAAGAGLGLVLTVGVYTVWMADTRRSGPVRGFRAALFGGLFGALLSGIVYANLYLNPPGVEPNWTGFWPQIQVWAEPWLGRVSGWLIAVPLGVSAGTFLGRAMRITGGKARGADFLARLGAATGGVGLLVAAPWLIPAGPPVRLDLLPVFGPGPLLACCERLATGRGGLPAGSVWPAIVVGKFALLAGAMLVLAAVGAMVGRARR